MASTLDRMKEATSLHASEYQLVLRYLDHLKLAREGWREQVARDETVVAEKMQALQKCHQERRLLENLRKKRYEEFRRELIKFLENQTEALVVTRWARS
jgi:flagellar biosynthesis chaperone FliJ